MGCTEDNEIEPVIDAALPECSGDETRECVVEGGCLGTQTCQGDSFGACEAPPEICDGVDNNCDGEVDEGFEGLGDPCTGGEGACVDKGWNVCNAAGDGVECNAVPGDGTDEVCDGIDNDCDGEVDDDVPVGMACETGRLGVCGAGTTACANGDTVCEPAAMPTDEICDGMDNDCDGRTDEGELGGDLAQPCYDGPEGTEGVGACAAGIQLCTDGTFGACVGAVTPGDEICDGVDNDCDGETDNAADVECVCVPGDTQPCYGGPEGTEGVGVCVGGTQTCLEDGTGYGECEGQRMPGTELCDTLDNDCDGEADNAVGVGEDCTVGQGACAATGTRVCDLESGQVVCDAEEGLPEDEICDGMDNDCDGMIDDVPGAGEPCTAGDGACLARGVQVCDPDAGELVCGAEPGEPGVETCDDIDNDCNGIVDDAPGVGVACEVGIGLCRSTGVAVCDTGTGEVVCPATEQDPTREYCFTGLDEDCDGEVDEDDCIIPCEEDGDCGVGSICLDGACAPGDCRGDDECDEGELCLDNLCTEADCRVDEDCEGEQICSLNTCIEVPGECLDPPTIGFGVVTGTTVGAGADFGGSCAPASQDVVFRFDPEGYTGPICVTTDGSDYDTKLHARSDCARQESELGCSDDDGLGLDSELQLDVDGEAFIIVDGHLDRTGNFVLTVTEGPCACRADGDCAEGEICRLGACVAPECGDGYVEGGEQCDDGNAEAGDGCSDACEVEAGYTCDEATGDCAEVGGLFDDDVRSEPGALLPENGIAPGGDAFENDCGAGEVIYGAEAAVGLGIERMRALCANFELGGATLVLDPDGDSGPVGVADAEFNARVVCPPNHAVVGYVAYLPAGVSLLCSPVSLEDGRLVFGEPVESDALGAPGLEAARETCPDGQAAGAHAGRADEDGVYAFSLRCDAYLDQCEGGSTCEMIGDCIDDEDCEGSESCVDFFCDLVEICDNGIDDEGDGQTDCEDEDCAFDPACLAPVGSCEAPTVLVGPGVVEGDTSGQPENFTETDPDCVTVAPGQALSAEAVVEFTAPADGTYCFSMAGSEFDTVLYVRENVCDDPAAEIACNDDNGAITGNFTRSALDIEAVADSTYYVIVDGFGEGREGRFTLTVTEGPCAPPPPPEICDNGEDDDGDGLTDCEDVDDCGDDPFCNPVGCVPDEFEAEEPVVIEPGAYEGLTLCAADLEGPDRFLVDLCPGGTLRVTVAHDPAAASVLNLGFFEEDDPRVAQESEGGVATGEIVNDTPFPQGAFVIDGEPDLVYDLLVEVEGCDGPVEICDNGVDDDGDALADCDDDDCAGDLEACPPEPVGSCEAPTVLVGAGVVEGNTTGQPANHVETDPDCVTVDPGQALSAEAVIAFQAPADGTYCFSTRDSAFDTVLYVRQDACDDPAAEIACNDDNFAIAGGTRSALSIDALAASTYFVFVDGFSEGRDGEFTLTVTEGECAPPPPPEVCDDRIDNDLDGLTDCEDVDDCADDPFCQPFVCVPDEFEGPDAAALLPDLYEDLTICAADGPPEDGFTVAVCPEGVVRATLTAGRDVPMVLIMGFEGDVVPQVLQPTEPDGVATGEATNLIGAEDAFVLVQSEGETDYDLEIEVLGCEPCGNGELDEGEQCDDGNQENGDGCDALCTIEDFAAVVPVDSIDGGFAEGSADNIFFTVYNDPTRLRAENSDGAGGCPGDAFLELFPLDAEGNRGARIASDDDDGIGVCSLLEVNDLAPGDYVLVSRGLGNRELAALTTDYRIDVDVSAGGTYDGGVEVGGYNLFALDIDGAAGVSLETTGADGCPGDLAMRLYGFDENGDRVELAFDDDDGVDFCALIEADLEAGAYEVEVEELDRDEAVPALQLVVTFDDGVCGDGVVNRGEGCDDGGVEPGDGCDDLCQVEDGFICDEDGCRPFECDADGDCPANTACNLENNLCEEIPGCDDGGNEPNDSREEATPAEPGVYPGLVLCRGDQDFYAIEVCAGGTLDVTIDFAGADGDVDMVLQDADGNELDGSRGFGDQESVTYTADGVDPETVYARVYLAQNTYDLTVTIEGCLPPGVCGDGVLNPGEGCDDGGVEPGDGCDDLCQVEDGFICDEDGCRPFECDADGDCPANTACNLENNLCEEIPGCDDGGNEPNDSREEATPAEPGVYPGLVLCRGDQDFYAIEVCAGGTLDVTIDFTDADGDVDMVLQDADGNELDGSRGVGDQESVTYTVDGVDPETVYARVYLAQNTYDLTVTIEGCLPPGVCGDGVLNPGEGCDDGGVEPGDGCDDLCQVEDGFICDEDGCRPFECDADGDCPANTACNLENNLCEEIPGCDDGGNEPNDSREAATPAEPGVYPGLALCRGDQDFYAIEVCAGGTVDVTIDFTNADGDVDMVLQDADGNELDGSRGIGDQESVTYTVDGVDPETVYARVYLAQNTYDLTVTIEGCLPPGVCGDGVLNPGEGCDDGGVEPGDGCDDLCQVEDGFICDEDGCRPFECDADGDCPANTACNLENNLCEEIPGCDDGGNEPNDSREAATPAEPGVYPGLALCRGDQDFYAIEVCAGGTVDVTIDFTGADGDVDMVLQDGDGNELDGSRSFGDQESVTYTADGVEPETVYARVYLAQNTYDLTVEVTCPELCDNRADDDDDGLTDCDDPDCDGEPACVGAPEGELIISEFLQNPSGTEAEQEWLELWNAGDAAVDLLGWTIADDDNDSVVIGESVVVEPGAYVVLGRDADPALNGGIELDYVLEGFTLANSSDEIVLIDPDGVERAAVRYDSGATFPDGNGASSQFDSRVQPLVANAADGGNWCEATQPYGDGSNLGTPGMPNEPCGPVIEPPLPIALAGEQIAINGSIDQGDMLWDMAGRDCEPGDGGAHPYDTYRVVNETGEPQQLYAQVFVDGDGDGARARLHAWVDPFDPAEGCIIGSRDGFNQDDDRLPLVDIAPGEVLVLVVSSETPDPDGQLQPIGAVARPYFGDYAIEVNTVDIQPDPVDFCRLQSPETIEGGEGDVVTVYGRYYEEGVTDETGHNPDFSPFTVAELGYIADGDDPADPGAWTWIPAELNDGQMFLPDETNNDEYRADLTLPADGLYSYAFRFSVDDGMSWQLCDLDGAGANLNPDDPASTFTLDQAGLMLVEAPLCERACREAEACGVFLLGALDPRIPDNYDDCVARCEAGEITQEQAQCVVDANDPPQCNDFATSQCLGLLN